ncbi:MAG: hypothetical protein AAB407_00520 [Patescibacteria group bacterium]
MSTSTFPQAAHTLTLIGQHDPSSEDLRVLHDGYLTDLIQAIQGGTVPDRSAFRKFVGLGPIDFATWKQVKLDTGLKTAADFRSALKKAGMKISNWANDILGKPAFTVAAEEVSLDLVVVSVADLGFKKGATRAQIYERARELGLDLCSAEVGPQLRLQYLDQPMNDWVLIGMEPIADSGGSLSVFILRRDGDEVWLDGSSGSADLFWFADYRWVFVRRK